MSTPGPTPTRRRAAELRAAAEARQQQERQRPLPPWLRRRTRRRVLALTPAVTLGLGAAAATVEGSAGLLLLVAMAAVGLAGAVVLPRATQMLATAPGPLLDEREVGQRDGAYRCAFSWALGLLGVLWVLALADRLAVRTGGAPLLPGDGWMLLLLAALLSAAALPTAVLAWRWEAPTED